MNNTRRITSANTSVQQTTHRLMSEELRCDLQKAVESGSLEECGTGSIRCRACVLLYLLLCDHSVDRRGRCLSCRRPGAVLGQRRRTCRIHVKATFWLRQPDDVVLRHLTNELRVGDDPDGSRLRRAPLDDHTPHPRQARYVVSSGYGTEVALSAD